MPPCSPGETFRNVVERFEWNLLAHAVATNTATRGLAGAMPAGGCAKIDRRADAALDGRRAFVQIFFSSIRIAAPINPFRREAGGRHARQPFWSAKFL